MPLDIQISYLPMITNDSTLIVKRNASRRYLIVSIWPPTKDLFLWPEQQPVASGISPPEGTNTVQLYRATLDDLIANDWYAVVGVPSQLMIIDAWDA